VEGGINWVVPEAAKVTLAQASERVIVASDERLAGVLNRVQDPLTGVLTRVQEHPVVRRVQDLPVVRHFKWEPRRAEAVPPEEDKPADFAEEEKKDEAPAPSSPSRWRSLRGDLTRKATQRLEAGLSTARAFSSGQLKSYIHVDLIEYATEVVDNAQSAAKPHYERINEQLAHAVVRVNSALEAVQVAAQKGRELVSPTELQQRLRLAIASARHLSTQGVQFVQENKSMLTYENLRSLPSQSVNFIMNAPAFFQNLQKAHEEGQLHPQQLGLIIVPINSLLTAVGDVIFRFSGRTAAPKGQPEPNKDEANGSLPKVEAEEVAPEEPDAGENYQSDEPEDDAHEGDD